MRAPPRFQFLPCLVYARRYRRCVSGFHQSVLLALVGPTEPSRIAQVKVKQPCRKLNYDGRGYNPEKSASYFATY